MSFNKWEKVTLEKGGIIIEDGDRGKNYPKSSEFSDSGYCIFLSTNNLIDDKVDINSCDYISEERDSLMGKGKVKKNDILLTTRGNGLGKLGLYKYSIPARINSGLVIIRSNNKILDNKFLYYMLRSNIGKNQFKSLSSGSAQPQLPIKDLKKLVVSIPPMEEQKRISFIMEILDEKIETNNEINKKLEEMAQAIFKQWFVDFEFPNEDGKPYKSSGGEMVRSELGMIPKGWEVKKVAEMIETILGGTPSRKNESYWENGSIAWINSGKINEFRITEPSEYITEEAVKKSSTKLLPKRTTVIAITGATLGQVSLLEIDSCTNQSVVGLKENEILKAEYIYCWMKEEIKLLANLQTGGAQQHINKDNVNMRNIIIPKKDILNKYYNIMESIFDKISNSVFEVRELTILRNTLLPKLMSGEIRVPID